MVFIQICQFLIFLFAFGQCQDFPDEPWAWGEDNEDLSIYQNPFIKTTKPSIIVTTMEPTRSTTSSPPNMPSPRICPGCPRTPQFHPVCGSDMATYDNPSAVECANTCGPKIEILFYAACQRTIGLVLPGGS